MGTPGWRRGEGWVTTLAVDPADSRVVWAGSGGGVKKSTDSGRSWKTVLWRGRFMGIGALAIAPTRPQTVYAGVSYSMPANCGAGSKIRCSENAVLLKTTDGGTTWQPTGLALADTDSLRALVVDPKRPTTLYAAVGSQGPRERRCRRQLAGDLARRRKRRPRPARQRRCQLAGGRPVGSRLRGRAEGRPRHLQDHRRRSELEYTSFPASPSTTSPSTRERRRRSSPSALSGLGPGQALSRQTRPSSSEAPTAAAPGRSLASSSRPPKVLEVLQGHPLDAEQR